MRLKKMVAAATAAAMLTVAVPMTGVLPDLLSVKASAASLDSEPVTHKEGDVFYTFIDSDGNCTGTVVDDVWESSTPWDGVDAFKCTVKSDETITISYYLLPATYYKLRGKTLTIPSEIGGYAVSAITDNGYNEFFRSGCRKIIIPDTVKSIGQSAFAFSCLLEEVEFGSNSQLELIDQWAFQDCRSLKSIIIPASVETIGYGAFLNSEQSLIVGISETYDYTNVYSLETVNFAAGSKLKAIGDYAFQRQKVLTSIELPNSVETLGTSTFINCTALSSVKLPTNLKALPVYTFSYCEALKTITIPSSVEAIGSVSGGGEVFNGCKSLEEVKFAENSNLKTIGTAAFFNMPVLKSITIPASVDTIGNYAFIRGYYTGDDQSAPIPTPSVLTNIYVDENNKTFKSVDGVVYSKDGTELVAYPIGRDEKLVIPEGVTKIKDGVCQGAYITSLTIPSSVTEISTDTFCDCYYLTEVNLPETLTTIGKWAFQRAGFTSITIPASVKSIDATAFEGSKLKTIYGVEGSYAETFAKNNGYEFNGTPADTDPDDSNTFTDDSEDKAADIEVIDTKGAIPKEAHFSVRIDDEHSSETRIAYNCYFTYNGANYEPTDVVTVRIPVPVSMQDIAQTLKVYHLQDGKYVAMDVTYVEENGFGYLVFETDHFSIYVVTPDVISNDDDNTGDDTTASDPAPAVPTIPSGNFQVPETTTAAATTTEATLAATEAADNSTANTSAAAVATTTTTTTAAVAAPADTNGSSGDTTQPVVSEDNSTADNGASAVGNDGAANDKGENPDTGSAIAIVPMIVAAAAVSFFAYKRKK